MLASHYMPRNISALAFPVLLIILPSESKAAEYKCANISFAINHAVTSTQTSPDVTSLFEIQGTPCGVWLQSTLANPNPGQRTNAAQGPKDSDGNKVYQPGKVTLTNTLPLDWDDGDFKDTVTVYWEDETMLPWTYGNFEHIAYGAVPKFVRIIGASWNPSTTSKTGYSDF